jgi:hypothetical protein
MGLVVTSPIVRSFYSEKLGKTVIETQEGTVFKNGSLEGSPLMVTFEIHEVGDTFIASSDSKTIDPQTKKPLFLKGDKVVRKTRTLEFKSVGGDDPQTRFVSGAKTYGLTLNLVMQG